MALAAGTRLGPYEVLGLIGAGGMGEVYKARDARLDRTVAIKVLPHELASDPERRARFEREARTISTLSHPHICTRHDVGEQDGQAYLVMEFLEGETLALRPKRGRVPLKDRFRSAVTNTSNWPIARASRSPFILPAHPISGTVRTSCPARSRFNWRADIRQAVRARASNASFACSRAATASARVTVGN